MRSARTTEVSRVRGYGLRSQRWVAQACRSHACVTIATLKKLLTLDPTSERAKQRLEELSQPEVKKQGA